ncbi:MAG: FHA domain-containing protein [Deltaproteobacteria bacterium]|nr:FHA domain-containing protein [Deltaproteobacteria bacterium]
MDGLYSVGALHEDAKRLTEEEFRLRFGDAFFLRGESTGPLQKPRVFQDTARQTTSPSPERALRGGPASTGASRAGPDVLAFLIFAARARDPTRQRITIGRTGNNDVVIPDQSVSKNHALLTRDGEAFVLRDVGSRTGTYVNMQQLEKGELRVIKGGDEIGFGDVAVTFLGVSTLHRFLRRVVPPS